MWGHWGQSTGSLMANGTSIKIVLLSALHKAPYSIQLK